MTRILLIPDMHVGHGDKLKRLDQLQNYIFDQPVLPSAIVQIGDLWDLESLCLHDKNTASWGQRSLQRDLDAGLKAVDRLHDLALDLGVPLYFVAGNHEYRFETFMQSDPRLASSPFPHTINELLMPFSNIHYTPFKDTLRLHGIAFSHYFVSGIMGRPVGGERPAANLLKTQMQSVVCGHSHVLDFAERTRADGTKIYALVSGCFVNPNKDFSYAGAARKLWWNGCHVLNVTAPGEFDLESISIKRLSNY